MINITLLGTGGMMPLADRALTGCLISYNGHSILVDCGEGMQVRVRESGKTFKPIDCIVLTHFHADHVSGLPGLLLSMGNSGREEDVLIVGPAGVERIVNSLRVIAPGLPFAIRFLELPWGRTTTFSAAGLDVTAFPLSHGMPCFGYSMKLERAGRFCPEKAKALGIPVKLWNVIQKQGSAEFDGKVFTQDMVMTERRKGLHFVYATDTRPVPALAREAQGADLAIFEGMYGDPEKQARAAEANHMMMQEAAAIAAQAQVGELWLTHYSPAMPDPTEWMPQVQEIFANAIAGTDGMTRELMFGEE